MKDYITAKERMNNLIIKKRKWNWFIPKYDTNNKNDRSSKESKHKNQHKGNSLAQEINYE